MAVRYEEAMKNIAEQVRATKADAVFGESRRVGEGVIIPVAKVSYGWGGGSGKGKTNNQTEEGEGSGAGMGAKVMPLGFIEIKGDETRYRPIVDIGKLLTAVAPLVILAAWRLLRDRNRQ